MNFSKIKNQIFASEGVAALIAIISITAVSLMIALTLTLIGVDEMSIGLDQTKTLETFLGTDGCIEEALVKLKSDTGYTGETLSMGDVSCTITVSGSGTTRTINVTATHDNRYNREIEVDVDWSTQYQITSWEEITT